MIEASSHSRARSGSRVTESHYAAAAARALARFLPPHVGRSPARATGAFAAGPHSSRGSSPRSRRRPRCACPYHSGSPSPRRDAPPSRGRPASRRCHLARSRSRGTRRPADAARPDLSEGAAAAPEHQPSRGEAGRTRRYQRPERHTRDEPWVEGRSRVVPLPPRTGRPATALANPGKAQRLKSRDTHPQASARATPCPFVRHRDFRHRPFGALHFQLAPCAPRTSPRRHRSGHRECPCPPRRPVGAWSSTGSRGFRTS